MNLVAVALNCTSDEYLHNITWSNIFDMGLIRDGNTVEDNEHIDIFKITSETRQITHLSFEKVHICVTN